MKIILTIAVAIIFLVLSKVFGFFVDITVFTLAAIFTFKFRKQIANVFSKNSKPSLAVILLSALPFIVFEELVNAPLRILPLTIPALLISVFFLISFLKQFKIKRVLPALFAYCIMGILFEINLGEASAQFATLDVFTYWFIVFWVGLSYSFITIIPLTLYTQSKLYEK